MGGAGKTPHPLMALARICAAKLSTTVMAASLIPPANTITRPSKHKEFILFGPGPSNCYPSVLEAMSKQPYGIMIPEMTKELLYDVREGLKYAFQTNNEATYCISGTGMSGMEATFVNILEPGDKVLVLENGLWGSRAADIIARLSELPNDNEKWHLY